jgi:hypothetical protein
MRVGPLPPSLIPSLHLSTRRSAEEETREELKRVKIITEKKNKQTKIITENSKTSLANRDKVGVSVAGSLLGKLLSKRPPQPRQKGAGNARGHRKRRLRVATMRATKVIGLALCVLCLILAVDLRPVDVGSTRGVLDAASVGRVLDSDVGFSIGRALRLDIGEFAPT